MIKKFSIIFFVSLIFLFFAFYPIHTIRALDSCLSQPVKPRAQGLISSATISPIGTSIFGNPTGQCIVDPRAAFTLPGTDKDYVNLKSFYYTQKNSSSYSYYKQPDTALPSPLSGSGLYDFTSNLTLGSITGSGVNIVFVDGNLTINNDITIPGASDGLVFVVSGDIVIAPGVVKIDSVLISNGTIYTAGTDCATNSVPANQLIINGSLVSLNQSKKIQFCRDLLSNNATLAAEKIIAQPKYLPILRNLFSQTKIITTEDTNFSINLPIN